MPAADGLAWRKTSLSSTQRNRDSSESRTLGRITSRKRLPQGNCWVLRAERLELLLSVAIHTAARAGTTSVVRLSRRQFQRQHRPGHHELAQQYQMHTTPSPFIAAAILWGISHHRLHQVP